MQSRTTDTRTYAAATTGGALDAARSWWWRSSTPECPAQIPS
jgi:hypothetical protein